MHGDVDAVAGRAAGARIHYIHAVLAALDSGGVEKAGRARWQLAAGRGPGVYRIRIGHASIQGNGFARTHRKVGTQVGLHAGVHIHINAIGAGAASGGLVYRYAVGVLAYRRRHKNVARSREQNGLYVGTRPAIVVLVGEGKLAGHQVNLIAIAHRKVRA